MRAHISPAGVSVLFDDKEEEMRKKRGLVPASTMPSTFSRMVFGSFVSLSLTVTVTSFQAIFLIVVFLRCASATAWRSTSILTTSMCSLSFTLSEGVLSTTIVPD
jgi:hypothetical protein